MRLKQNIRLLSQLLRNRRAPLLVLRHLGRAGGSHPVGAGGDRPGGPHLRHAVPLRRRHGRDRVDRPRAGRLRQGGRARGAAGAAAASPDRLVYVGRRQLRRPRDAARQPAGRPHGGGVGEQYLTPIARRTVLSDDALSVLVPVLEEIVGLESAADPRALRGARASCCGSGTRCGPTRSRSARRPDQVTRCPCE